MQEKFMEEFIARFGDVAFFISFVAFLGYQFFKEAFRLYSSRKREKEEKRKMRDMMEYIHSRIRRVQEIELERGESAQVQNPNLSAENKWRNHAKDIRLLFLTLLHNANYLMYQYARTSPQFRTDDSYARIRDTCFDITYFYTTYKTYLTLFSEDECSKLEKLWENLENSVREHMNETALSDQKALRFARVAAVKDFRSVLLDLINKVDASIFKPEAPTEGE